MATRGQTALGEIDVYRGGMSPFERAASIALSQRPGAFDFEELEERYPTRSVLPAIPEYAQRQLDEEELARKSNEVLLRQREAQLNIYESQLNQERARYEQIPSAREAMAKLDPSAPDFIQQVIGVQQNLPLAFEDDSFYKTVVAPLYQRHERLQNIKKQSGIEDVQLPTPKDYEDMIVRRDMLLGKKDLAELQEEEPDKAFAVEQLNRMIFDYQQQNIPRGGFGGAPTMPSPAIPSVQPTPQPTQGGGLNALRSFIGE